MADRKPVIKIDVDDKAFKEFKASFDNLKKNLDKMPAGWKNVNSAISRVGKEIENAEKASQKTSKNTLTLSKYVKESAKWMRDFSTQSNRAGKSVHAIYKWTSKITSKLTSATKSLTKWVGIGGILSGLSLAGGLFGFNNLAQGASNTRFQSNSLGISAGDLKAANVNLGRLISDPASLLSSIQGAQTDLTKKWAFRANGINPDGKSAADLVRPLIESVQQRFKGRNVTSQELDATGLNQFFSVGDVTNIQRLKKEEVQTSLQKLDADRKQLDVQEDTLRKYQDFNQALDRSKEKIENTFLGALQSLAPALEKLAPAITNLIEIVLKSSAARDTINSLETGINKLAKYLGSDSVKSDVSTFLDSLDSAAGAMYSFASGVGSAAQKLFGGEVTLTGSQYKKIRSIKGTNPQLASVLQNYLENPSKQGNLREALLRAEIEGGLPSDRAGNISLVDELLGKKIASSSAVAALTVPGKPLPKATNASQLAYLSSIEKRYGLDKSYGPGVLDRLHFAESSRGVAVRSGKGAVGPFQFLADTGKEYGLNSESDRLDFYKSGDAAGKFLSKLIKWAKGDPVKAIAGYHTGIGYVNKWGDKWKDELGPQAQREISVVIYNNTGGNTFANVNQIAQ